MYASEFSPVLSAYTSTARMSTEAMRLMIEPADMLPSYATVPRGPAVVTVR